MISTGVTEGGGLGFVKGLRKEWLIFLQSLDLVLHRSYTAKLTLLTLQAIFGLIAYPAVGLHRSFNLPNVGATRGQISDEQKNYGSYSTET